MAQEIDFSLSSPQPVTQAFAAAGITRFADAVTYVRKLRYGRISQRNNCMLVLTEQRGTCSSKHQLLALLAVENDRPDIQLVELLFRMNERNVPGTGAVLARHNLPYMPEAHNYLRAGDTLIDATSENVRIDYEGDKISEIVISPHRTTEEKMAAHRTALEHWRNSHAQAAAYTLNELYTIRESCIAAIA
ncbi:MAG: hypothetical protein MUC87_08610 [Bacteroidia bacterium]|jgi:hypothetical protein|nr:hypothetical protein [Bacteroidia bacterium]